MKDEYFFSALLQLMVQNVLSGCTSFQVDSFTYLIVCRLFFNIFVYIYVDTVYIGSTPTQDAFVTTGTITVLGSGISTIQPTHLPRIASWVEIDTMKKIPKVAYYS